MTVWGVAAGVAASALLFTVGWLASPDAVEPTTALNEEQGIDLDTADAVLEALNRIEELEKRNARLEQQVASFEGGFLQAESRGTPQEPTSALLTRNEFEEGLARMLTRFDYQIQQESQYLLSEMAERDRRYIEAWRLVTREMPAPIAQPRPISRHATPTPAAPC